MCKNKLADYKIIYDKKIRGDLENNCKNIECTICNHIQLVGFRKNLKQHYDDDNQSNDIIQTFNITLNEILNKEKIEVDRRIDLLNLNKKEKYSILDIGSGYCSFAKKVSDINVKVTCFEPSEKRINTGKTINNIKNNDNIEFYNTYLDNEFALKNKNSFDIVTSWHVFEHLDENHIDTLLENMLICCKEKGKIIIEVPNSNDELLKIDKYKRINYMIHHLSYWNEKSLIKLAKRNKVSNFEIKYTQRYGFNNYLNWIYNLGEKQDCDMNDNSKNMRWLNAKTKAKNTDAIILIIYKLYGKKYEK